MELLTPEAVRNLKPSERRERAASASLLNGHTMNANYRACIISSWVLCVCAANFAGEPNAKELQQIQADVKLLRESVYRPMTKAEVEHALKLLHPDMIESVGGPMKARLNAASGTRTAAQSLFTIESTEFPDPPEFFTGKEHEFIIVPVKLTPLRADRKRDISGWYYLGGRKKGTKDWVYVDVPRLSEKGPAAFFADFPEEKKLPPLVRKQIDLKE